jgi:tetratricopeptide (TPR) repeat protein
MGRVPGGPILNFTVAWAAWVAGQPCLGGEALAVAVPVLRFNDVPLGGGQRRVEVFWQDGMARQVAVSSFAYQVSAAEAEKVRWYLEDYPEFPANPAPRLALDAESVLAETGKALFSRVFAGMDAAGIWGRARDRLGQVRVEVDTDPAEAPGLPWELLRDRGSDTPLALAAGTFVRTHLQAAGQVGLPEAAGDRLRVLLVICRPGQADDVPFRSVASRLARSGAAKMEGLDLDVLRPATFARLARVLHQAASAGRPYHVVHFDGHGTYLDLADLQTSRNDHSGGADGIASGGGGIGVSPLRYGISVAGPVRPGPHGYLIFEDPASGANQQMVDGPALGRLLATTGVPVLVLNACRSAWTEAPSRPGQLDPRAGDTEASRVQGDEVGGTDGASLADVHARIRAYGSLAAEVADAGVPGVVAMRYNVYVVTAAQYAADLYAHLLAGRTVGEAATAARRALAADPTRHVGGIPVALQDWAVPMVYEAAPLTLLRPSTSKAPLIQVTPDSDEDGMAGDQGGLPRPPDAGFFGRDETLLALDRAFDTQQVVLLHAYAGAGKTSTAGEFARWYAATGGLHHPALGAGQVLWSSFEHHLPLDRLLDMVGDCFAGLLEANGIHWQAITSTAQRRDLVLQLLNQVLVLWVWDNAEPVTGFPPGTQSAWTDEEQDQIAAFLRDLAQQTKCKVLVTSRRDEQPWLGDLPARVLLPPMPMRERLQLAGALGARHPGYDPGTDWRPLLHYTAGNPLTITVLVGQALRDRLTTTADLEGFVERLKAGEQDLELCQDAALGRTQSLAASLSYGFTHAFTDAERSQLAVLHLFRDTVDAGALSSMGDPNIAGDDAVPQLAGLTRDTALGLLDRAAAIGLLAPLGGGCYAIHPALPWYFTTLYTTTYGPSNSSATEQTARAYTHTLAQLGGYYHYQAGQGRDVAPVLQAEEANLHHALTLARTARHWDDVTGCLQGLRILYGRTGRDAELARLVTSLIPDLIDPATDGPLPGRESQWSLFTEYRVRLACDARDWPTATRLQNLAVVWDREQATAALAVPESQLISGQRIEIRTLAASLQQLAQILFFQQDPGCLPYYQEALSLTQRIHDRPAEQVLAVNLGSVHMDVPSLRDLDQARSWYQRSLDLTPGHDRIGRGQSLGSLANVAYRRFREAKAADEPQPVLREHLNTALRAYQQAIDLFPDDDAEDLAIVHLQLGNVYSVVGDTRQALHHYQQSIRNEEARGNIYGAGVGRYNIALLLQDDGRPGDALHYARAALHDYKRVGPGAAEKVALAQELITRLEQHAR